MNLLSLNLQSKVRKGTNSHSFMTQMPAEVGRFCTSIQIYYTDPTKIDRSTLDSAPTEEVDFRLRPYRIRQFWIQAVFCNFVMTCNYPSYIVTKEVIKSKKEWPLMLVRIDWRPTITIFEDQTHNSLKSFKICPFCDAIEGEDLWQWVCLLILYPNLNSFFCSKWK